MKIEFKPGLKIECLLCAKKSKITAKGKVPKGLKFGVTFFVCPKDKRKLKIGTFQVSSRKKKLTKKKKGTTLKLVSAKRLLKRRSRRSR